MAHRNVAALEALLDGYSEDEYAATGAFAYQDTDLVLSLLNRVESLESEGCVDPAKILLFTPDYVDALLVSDFNPIETLPPALMRGAFDISYWHLGVAANKACGFSTIGSGEMELIAVASPGGKISVEIITEDDSPVTMEAQADSIAATAQWEMPRSGKFTVMVHNDSDTDISVIVAIN